MEKIDAQSSDQALAPRREVYSAEEHEQLEIPSEYLLADSGELRLYPEVVRRGFFRIWFRDQDLIFQPGPYVGLMPINDRVAIDIQPRVPISNLARLLRLTKHRPTLLEEYLRDYEVEEGPFPSLIDCLAKALVNEISIVKAKGRHYEYQQKIKGTPFPRGRILMSQTINRFASHGISHKVVTSQYERSPNTAPNRCLKYAVWYLAQRYFRMRNRSGAIGLLSRLNQAYHLFNDVGLDHSRRFLSHPLVVNPEELNPSYVHYRRALSIAVAIVEEKGVRLEGLGDEVTIASLLIKVDDIFEEYVRIVLQKQLADLEPRISVLDGNLAGKAGGRKQLFDDTGNPPATPDIVVQDNQSQATDEKYPLVIEVKYKPLKGLPKREDLNQLVAYAYSYHAPVAVIVQPVTKASAQNLNRLGRIGPTGFYQYGFDLSAKNLRSGEEAFANRLRRLINLNTN